MATAVSFAQESVTMPISLVATSKLPTTLKQVGQRRDYQMINPHDIEIEDGFNPRRYDLPENRAHLDELKVSIAEIGLIQPLIVRLNRETGKAVILDGECRWRAIMELIAEGHPVLVDADIPCFPAPAGSNDEASRLLTAITANTGKPLSKWELGGAFQKLYNLGLSLKRSWLARDTPIGLSVRLWNWQMPRMRSSSFSRLRPLLRPLPFPNSGPMALPLWRH